MNKRTSRQAQMIAMVKKEAPELWLEGTWVVLSNCIGDYPGDSVYLDMVVDVYYGRCLALIASSGPLGQRVGNLLDSVLTDDYRPACVFTDNRRNIHLGNLVAWGRARGISTYFHPACTIPGSVLAIHHSLMDLFNSLEYKTAQSKGLEGIGAQLCGWRRWYNGSLHT